jgi:hypothetical protein
MLEHTAIKILMLSVLAQPVHSIDVNLLVQLPNSQAFSIYCTSNLDSTGACTRVDNSEPVSCEMIPGGIINCKQEGEPAIQCVIYSGVIGSQAYFYCTHRTDPGIRDNRINSQRFNRVNPSTPSSQQDGTILAPPSNFTDIPSPQNSEFSDPIKDLFTQ